jgi:preprotein translocase subunit SecB
MKASPLHLEGYHVAEFFFRVNDAFEKKTPFGAWTGYHYHPDKPWKIEPTDFTVDAELFRKTDDPSRIRYVLTIKSAGRKEQFPYAFRISVVGYFHIDKSFPEEKTYMLIYASAPSLLYGSVREMLATMTGRGPYPAIILPAATFYDDAIEVAEKAKRIREGSIKKRKQLGSGKKATAVTRAKKR